MKVVAYEPYPNREFCEKWNIELVDDVNDVFRRADFVTIHAPGEGGNAALVNTERLALMKPTAFLINTARGVLVDEDALYEALTSKKIAGAGLDVRQHEPPEDDRFSALDNVVLTPHISGLDGRGSGGQRRDGGRAGAGGGRGEKPHGLLNPDVWEKRRREAHRRSSCPPSERSIRPTWRTSTATPRSSVSAPTPTSGTARRQETGSRRSWSGFGRGQARRCSTSAAASGASTRGCARPGAAWSASTSRSGWCARPTSRPFARRSRLRCPGRRPGPAARGRRLRPGALRRTCCSTCRTSGVPSRRCGGC